MKKRMRGMTALALLGAAGMAVAADGTKVPTVLETVVVSATKTEEKASDVPNAVVLRDSLDIAEGAVRSVGELLAADPGIDWRTRGNYGGAAEELHLRGMDGSGTQVFLNGININSPSLGTADLGRLPLGGIDRVEVVKGAGSLLYGTGAMGGTVNVLTRDPERGKTDLRLSGGIGDQGANELSFEQGMYLSDALGYYLTASRRETDGFRDNADAEQHDASVKLLWDKGKTFRASWYTMALERDFGVPGVRPPAGTAPYAVHGTTLYNGDSASLVNRGADHDLYSVMELKGSPADVLTFTLRGEYVDMESYNSSRNAMAVFPLAAGAGNESWVTNTVKGIEGIVEYRPTSAAVLLAGAQHRDYNYENEQGDLNPWGVPLAGSTIGEEHQVYTDGVYAELQYRLLPNLRALAGARHEEHSTFGGETLPRFGLTCEPLAGTTLKFSHGKHFKAPTMNDLYWPDSGWVKGNTDLKAETGWHSDIGVLQQALDKRLELGATWFQWDIDDRIAWAENPSQPTSTPGFNYWTPSNVSQSEGRGAELSAGYRPLAWLRLALAYTYINAEDESEPGIWRQALYTPEQMVRGELSAESSFGLSGTLVIRHVGERPGYYARTTDVAASRMLDDYWTVDVKLSQRVREHWIVSCQVNNLLDEEYDTYLATFRDMTTNVTSRVGYPGAGRSVFAKVTYEF